MQELIAGGWQWAFGHGKYSQHTGVPIYIPSGYSAEIVAVGFNSSGISSGTVRVGVNGVADTQDLAVSGSAGSASMTELTTPVSITSGDYVNAKTTNASISSGIATLSIAIRFYKV